MHLQYFQIQDIQEEMESTADYYRKQLDEQNNRALLTKLQVSNSGEWRFHDCNRTKVLAVIDEFSYDNILSMTLLYAFETLHLH